MQAMASPMSAINERDLIHSPLIGPFLQSAGGFTPHAFEIELQITLFAYSNIWKETYYQI